ncbi:hypothetical protein [Ornithinimicrobium cerasi]|uniref:hypothetical protein n=1 Tax=Ornithinimicrobium cerasi TaxID=2248773 RepID=UPI000F00E1A9|nr:hypothetical protein [Ornithinimicrobium cerasi]
MSVAAELATRWAGRAGTIAFVLVALALGRVVGDQVPSPIDSYARPHEVVASQGRPVQLRAATITVDGVTVSRSFQTSSSLYESPGIFVLADVTFTPTLEDSALGHVEIVDRQGRSFTVTRTGGNTCPLTAPGLPTRCSVVLELPPDALPGATLRLGTDGTDTAYQDLAVVDLGLDAQDAQLAADAEPLEPREPLLEEGG